MKDKRRIYLFSGLASIVFIIWLFFNPDTKNEDFSEKVKVALRDVGHQLLLANQDSTSLVLPVIELDKSKYQLTFKQQLSFDPSRLVAIVDSSFQKSELPRYYRVEVIQCTDKEVAYSYEIEVEEEKTIIPCGGRFLPENCYIVEVKFINRTASIYNKQMFLYLILVILFLVLNFVFYKKKRSKELDNNEANFATLGSFQFYPDQNKLVKQAVEISLSKKECELLEIFVANPNQIIKREELEKKVWEDNGVVVGRSLDTYISKLRKKLKDDESIKLINVHGVGYKLEITLDNKKRE